ncbi:hypothetical protein HHI36_019497 [Cryptolaemus montrouzieri]|uniref:CDT1 Geminin-binding domain-containing protein n=1 Tax=Cryptolaemus montrouzieri TaxID=559131 RepID=A0ABD2P3D8_9CUCU
MAQPSVAAYFNTRKRVAVDDIKINRARKVLIVDEGEEKISQRISPVFSSECEDKNVESDKCKEVDKFVPNKIVNKANSMAKKLVKSRTTTTGKRRVIPGINGQQNLQNFVTRPSADETVKYTDCSNVKDDLKQKHFTPPASPVKSQNAMDKVSESPVNVSLNALKLKLSRSSRLAELKASLSRFNESHNKLKEIEKVTSNISVSPKPSPKLQSFKSIELEVNLSPQKLQSPEKLYLSPKKDVTARKNLLNLLSPIKNTVSFCEESPSKKIQELNTKPALTLPFKYRYFAEMFRAVDTVCQLLFNRKETITLTKLKPAVEKMTKRNVTNRCLAQIKHIYPTAFKFHQEKLRVFGSGKREERWDLVINPIVESERITSEILLTRRRILFDLLLDKVKDYHHEFLTGLEPPMIIPKDKITRWHPEFDIERVPDIEEDKLPELPEEQKMISGQEVLQKARQMFSCNTRIEQALERLKEKR